MGNWLFSYHYAFLAIKWGPGVPPGYGGVRGER